MSLNWSYRQEIVIKLFILWWYVLIGNAQIKNGLSGEMFEEYWPMRRLLFTALIIIGKLQNDDQLKKEKLSHYYHSGFSDQN